MGDRVGGMLPPTMRIDPRERIGEPPGGTPGRVRRRPASATRASVRLMAVVATAMTLLLPGAVASAQTDVTAVGPAFHLEPVLSGYSRPLLVTAGRATNRLFVVEQGGRIRAAARSSAAGRRRKQGVSLDLRDRVAGPLVGRGLLGLASRVAAPPAEAT